MSRWRRWARAFVIALATGGAPVAVHADEAPQEEKKPKPQPKPAPPPRPAPDPKPGDTTTVSDKKADQ